MVGLSPTEALEVPEPNRSEPISPPILEIFKNFNLLSCQAHLDGSNALICGRIRQILTEISKSERRIHQAPCHQSHLWKLISQRILELSKNFQTTSCRASDRRHNAAIRSRIRAILVKIRKSQGRITWQTSEVHLQAPLLPGSIFTETKRAQHYQSITAACLAEAAIEEADSTAGKEAETVLKAVAGVAIPTGRPPMAINQIPIKDPRRSPLTTSSLVWAIHRSRVSSP